MLKGIKHHASKVMKYESGGSVQRSESTEAARADRTAKDREADTDEALKKLKYEVDARGDNANFRVQKALTDRAISRAQSARDRAAVTRQRTGYPNMGYPGGNDPEPSQRLKNSPVSIGDDD